jgi:hypothetical protein
VVQFGIHSKQGSEPNARLLGRKHRAAPLAQIPFGFAQGRPSLRKERLLGMTTQNA